MSITSPSLQTAHENQAGDQFPRDPTQWRDTDLDQHGDNTWGNNPDAFIFDNQEWEGRRW